MDDVVTSFFLDLENISDSDLVFIRNHVRWECERRINNKELKK